MKIVVTGGAGFLGKKLIRLLLERGELTGPSGEAEPISAIVALDTAAAPDFGDPRVSVIEGSVADRAAVDRAITPDTASVFHLAAIVSAGAEADFDLGYSVNLDGTRHVLEACRRAGSPPRVVFTSSIAVYGGDLPEIIDDSVQPLPQLSYGIQKLIGESLIADYTRKGFIDGRSLRLPTVMVRTGLPNPAASTWASSIIREPLSGKDVDCPVEPRSYMACLSARRTVDSFIRMHELPSDALGLRRSVQLRGIPVTAGEMAEAVTRNAGNRKLGAIHWRTDPQTQAIVDGWPRETQSARASALGFQGDTDIDEIVRGFIADDLDEQIRDFG